MKMHGTDMTFIPIFVRIGQVVQKFENRGGGGEQTSEAYFFRLRKETSNCIEHSSR